MSRTMTLLSFSFIIFWLLAVGGFLASQAWGDDSGSRHDEKCELSRSFGLHEGSRARHGCES